MAINLPPLDAEQQVPERPVDQVAIVLPDKTQPRGAAANSETAPSASLPLNYLLAHQRFRAVAARVDPLVAKVVAMSGRLQHTGWQRVAITNSTATFPAGLLVSLDAGAWPDIHQLAQAMSEWHESRAALHDAWEKVPNEQRGGLQPPSEEAPK